MILFHRKSYNYCHNLNKLQELQVLYDYQEVKPKVSTVWLYTILSS